MPVDEIKRRLAEIDDLPDRSLGEFNKRWNRQLLSLQKKDYLEADADGQPQLCPGLRAIASNLSTKRQNTFVRYDYVDEEWLLRQLVLYPQKETTIQLGSLADGTIMMAAMTDERLADSIAEVVGSLPNLDTLDLAARSVTDMLLGR